MTLTPFGRGSRAGGGGVGGAEDQTQSHFQAVQTVVPKTEQLCPLVSLALLNES